jgi:aryl-alcohol dehydrogenase-like predicted oxidoreductase
VPALPTRRLGHSGIEVSVLGLGCESFGRRVSPTRARAVVEASLAEGVTFFDTADIYAGDATVSANGASEALIGQVLRGRLGQAVLATKFGMDMGDGRGPRGSRAYILQAVRGSLARLCTDRIDLYWYHEPDGVTPIWETLGALDDLVRAGKIRAIGASNFSAGQIEEADAVAREHGLTRFTAVQNEYSLLVRHAERDVLPTCERLGLAFIPYFPLASGLLTGKYRRGEPSPEGTFLGGRDRIATDEQFDVVEALSEFAADRGLSLIELAIGGLLANATVASVIAGATKPGQVHANAAAARWRPSKEDVAALNDLLGALQR